VLECFTSHLFPWLGADGRCTAKNPEPRAIIKPTAACGDGPSPDGLLGPIRKAVDFCAQGPSTFDGTCTHPTCCHHGPGSDFTVDALWYLGAGCTSAAFSRLSQCSSFDAAAISGVPATGNFLAGLARRPGFTPNSSVDHSPTSLCQERPVWPSCKLAPTLAAPQHPIGPFPPRRSGPLVSGRARCNATALLQACKPFPGG
jgi:hypothetical protein